MAGGSAHGLWVAQRAMKRQADKSGYLAAAAAGRAFGPAGVCGPSEPRPSGSGHAGQPSAAYPLPYGRGSATARAFTLIELIVSIGILAVMMTMAGAVYKLTLDSTGQATALLDVSQSLRLLEHTLREDLANVNAGRSMLVIQSAPINAYWRDEYVELDDDGDPFDGYPHEADPEREKSDGSGDLELPRADVLMFFTSRQTTSYMYPQIWSDLVQVVYGHAEVGELDSTTGTWVGGGTGPSFFLNHDPATMTFPLAAESWHLARRCVLLVDAPENPSLDQYDPAWTTGGDDVPNGIDDLDALGGGVRNVSALRDGLIDVVDDTFDFEAQVVNRANVLTPPPAFDVEWFRRSRLDLQPPATLASRLGHYFVPGCASFKVEWALDLRAFPEIGFNTVPGNPDSAPQELVWFDPGSPDVGTGTPLAELETLAQTYNSGAPTVAANLRTLGITIGDRFRDPLSNGVGLGATSTPVWFANDQVNTGGSAGDPDRYFPVALRVTVDIYDGSNRFDRPMRHVMILPVGEP